MYVRFRSIEATSVLRMAVDDAADMSMDGRGHVTECAHDSAGGGRNQDVLKAMAATMPCIHLMLVSL